MVYYTELTEHNKEAEINHAIAGETIYDGYIKDVSKEKGKIIIKEMIDEMNSNQSPIEKNEIIRRLEDCLA